MGAVLLDFTGTAEGFHQLKKFDQSCIDLIRKGSDEGRTLVVVVDRAVNGSLKAPAVVTDHLNLTGGNPLIGPNDEHGERFPVVQEIYVDDCLPSMPQVVVAGLKQGVVPSAEDAGLLKSFGVECATYNIVPAMLIAAHAKSKVLAIVLPKGASLDGEHMAEIKKITGAKA
jgi:hypothetical protein